MKFMIGCIAVFSALGMGFFPSIEEKMISGVIFSLCTGILYLWIKFEEK